MGEISEKIKGGLFKYGFVSNLKEGEYITELNRALEGAIDDSLTPREIYEIADLAAPIYLNDNGYKQDRYGNPVSAQDAMYVAFSTGYSNINGKIVYGWFEKSVKDEKAIFVGVNWGTIDEIRVRASNRAFFDHSFKMGKFFFENREECNAFLSAFAKHTIEEDWNYKKKPSNISCPILKSYIQTLFTKLEKEQEDGRPDRIIRSKDGSHIIFNTNLLDKFFNDEYIIAEVKPLSGAEVYIDPVMVSKGAGSTFVKYGFDRNVSPLPPRFFENVDEVIFHPEREIERDYDNLSHIIEKRIYRFPEEFRNMEPDRLARKLYEAMDYALAIAQRNYKYIVPIYYPKFDTISFIMPIFLDGHYKKRPDFALVLQNEAPKDGQPGYYIARTILELEDGYQDARVIAKPDESWLNPNEIK